MKYKVYNVNNFWEIPHIQNIRIGTKSLSYCPYRFLTDSDADDLLKLFEKIVNQELGAN